MLCVYSDLMFFKQDRVIKETLPGACPSPLSMCWRSVNWTTPVLVPCGISPDKAEVPALKSLRQKPSSSENISLENSFEDGGRKLKKRALLDPVRRVICPHPQSWSQEYSRVGRQKMEQRGFLICERTMRSQVCQIHHPQKSVEQPLENLQVHPLHPLQWKHKAHIPVMY